MNEIAKYSILNGAYEYCKFCDTQFIVIFPMMKNKDYEIYYCPNCGKEQ